MPIGHRWIFGCWAALTVLAGSIFTSFHQPFQPPAIAILKLASPVIGHQLRLLHVLSASCECSERVMRHLIARSPFASVTEQVIVLDGAGAELPGTSDLVSSLRERGFGVRRLSVSAVPPEAELRGVPLLLIAAPDDSLLYMGGYGEAFDQDGLILTQVEKKMSVKPLVSIGCAVSQRLSRQADPFHLR